MDIMSMLPGASVLVIQGLAIWIIKSWLSKQSKHNEKMYTILEKVDGRMDNFDKSIVSLRSNETHNKEDADRNFKQHDEFYTAINESKQKIIVLETRAEA